MRFHINSTRLLGMSGMLAALGMVGCTDLQRTNPFDPNMPVVVSLSGPDTVTAVGQQFTLTVETTPSWDDPPLTWEVPGNWATDAVSGHSRTFHIPFGWVPDTQRVTVFAGPHRGSRLITLDQKLAQVRFLPCPLNTCVMVLDEPHSAPRLIGLTHWDATDHAMMDLNDVPASVANSIVSRDPSIIQINYVASNRDFVALTPKAQGSTYIVNTLFGSDSVLVYADWAADAIDFSCPAKMAVGDSIPLEATVVSDGGIPLIRPVEITWELDSSSSATGTLSDESLTASTTGTLILVIRSGGLINICEIAVFTPTP